MTTLPPLSASRNASRGHSSTITRSMRLMTYRIPTADPLGIADVRPRTANATVLARGWSMFSNALSAASDKGDVDRAMRPSRTMHSSSAMTDTASITSSEGPWRNRLASIGRASILPICPSAHAAALATARFRSSRRSIITDMSSGRRQAQRHALARTSGAASRKSDRKTSTGRVACSCAASTAEAG
jgi:hypothetical protein